MYKKVALGVIVIFINGFSSGVLAAENNPNDTDLGISSNNDNSEAALYLGVSVGASQSSYLDDELKDIKISPSGKVESEDSSGGWKIYGGADVNEYLGVQLDIVGLGKFTYKEKGAGYNFDASIDGVGVYANAVVKLPFIKNRGALFVKAGAGFAVVTQDVDGNVGTSYLVRDQRTESGGSFTIGAGIKYNVTPRWGVIGEIERYYINIEDEDGKADFGGFKVNMMTAGIYYRIF